MEYKEAILVDISDIPVVVDGVATEINLCMCKEPIKEHSKTTCTCCWWCKKCGKFGGCDNLVSYYSIKEMLKNE